MEDTTKPSLFERVHKRLSVFFDDRVSTRETVEEALQNGDIVHRSIDILPYLQTALFDEKIVEVELDGASRTYFCKIHDDLPDLVPTEIEGETVMVEPKYKPGDYLKSMTHIITLPVEPGIGNLNIRNTKKILLRMFTTSYAVELGTFFQDITLVRELPVLRLAFPVIGRLVHGAREFRAKVPEKMDAKVMVVGKKKQDSVVSRIVDVSVSGMAFSIKKNQQQLFFVNEVKTFELIIDGMMEARLNGKIRHVSRIRGKKGTEYICGVQFELINRAITSKIESIVTTVQRAHLKELSDKSLASGLDLIA